MGRGDLSDAEWAIIGPFLPAERGRSGRPAHGKRRLATRYEKTTSGFLAMLHLAATWLWAKAIAAVL